MGRRPNNMKPKKQETVEKVEAEVEVKVEVVDTPSSVKPEKVSDDTPRFSKKQFVASRKYARVKDYLNGNLENDKLYTIKEVDEIVNKLYNKVR